jgi:hypothetical protein
MPVSWSLANGQLTDASEEGGAASSSEALAVEHVGGPEQFGPQRTCNVQPQVDVSLVLFKIGNISGYR